MSDRLLSADARSVALEVDDLDPDDVVAGIPIAASVALGEVAGVEVGVWEITPGTVRDTEVEEIFVVLAGDGTVRFADGTAVELGPGTVVRLQAGERTEWEIRSTLRKVYVAG